MITWEEAIRRFDIPQEYHDVKFSEVEKKYPFFSELGREWFKEPRSLYLSGCTGSGKTYFSMALLRNLIAMKNGLVWVIWVRSSDLDRELLLSMEPREEYNCLRKYYEVPYLFIDDLGLERATDRVITQYTSIIDRRINNNLPTIFTSNLSVDEIVKNLGDRIQSRLSVIDEIKFPKRDLRKELIRNCG